MTNIEAKHYEQALVELHLRNDAEAWSHQGTIREVLNGVKKLAETIAAASEKTERSSP